MSKYKAIYENNQIVYWPFFGRCLGLIIFSGIIIIIDIVAAFVCYSAMHNMSDKYFIITLCLIILFVFGCTLFFALHRMFMRVCVTYFDIIITNGNSKKIQISWKDVDAIYIYQNSWHGMLFYKVFLINSQYSSVSKGQCDLLVPLYSVDTDILHKFIPKGILKSNIYNNV